VTLHLVLDDARAEAKRRGHGQVLVGHIAVVLPSRYPDALGDEWSEVLARAERQLQSAPVSFEPPDSSEVESLLGDVLRSGNSTMLVERVRGLVMAGEAATLEAPTEAGVGVVIPQVYQRWITFVDADESLIGREFVVQSLVDSLHRRDRTPILLVGHEGSGRTAIAGGLAAALVDQGLRVVRYDSASSPSEQRVPALTEMLRLAQDQGVLFIDDYEVALGLGFPAGADSQMLLQMRPMFERGGTRVITVIAAQYLTRLQGTDREMVAEFARVDLPELTAEQLLQVVTRQAQEIETFHSVKIPTEVVAAALAPPEGDDLGTHPALAIRRLDIAASRVARLGGERLVSVRELPLEVKKVRRIDPLALGQALRQDIVGQDAAIDRVTARLAITVAEIDLSPHRPDGVFLFAGPTGVGKTALAMAMARELFGSDNSLLRIDMSELHGDHTVSRLVGAPPGYIGHDNSEGWLTTLVRRTPRCLLLLDEIEKADPRVWNTFLQVFDAGRLTDQRGLVADFRDVVIVMTTNLGAEVFTPDGVVGFVEVPDTAGADVAAVRRVLQQTMKPELLNRIDEVLIFSPLSPESVRLIAAKQIAAATERLQGQGYRIVVTPEVFALVERLGFSPTYGARELLRTIERLVLQPLAAMPAGAYAGTVDGDLVTWVPS